MSEQFSAAQIKQAVQIRDRLWSACLSWKEDGRIEALETACTSLCGGNRREGQSLATTAIWS